MPIPPAAHYMSSPLHELPITDGILYILNLNHVPNMHWEYYRIDLKCFLSSKKWWSCFQEISKSVLWGAWDLRRVKSWNLVTHNLYNYLFKYICTHKKTFKRKKNKLKHISYYEKCTKRRIILFCAMFTIFVHYYVM